MYSLTAKLNKLITARSSLVYRPWPSLYSPIDYVWFSPPLAGTVYAMAPRASTTPHSRTQPALRAHKMLRMQTQTNTTDSCLTPDTRNDLVCPSLIYNPLSLYPSLPPPHTNHLPPLKHAPHDMSVTLPHNGVYPSTCLPNVACDYRFTANIDGGHVGHCRVAVDSVHATQSHL